MDSIPSEFLKLCKQELVELITTVMNYIIECRSFPDLWAEGLYTPVFKNGRLDDTNNYRGITVLSVFAKIFETAVKNRMVFVSEAFQDTGEANGGFLKGSRTTDNIFILLGLIQRQLFLGKSLYLCMVDFSKAFDLVNRHILFYKLMKQGYHGRVIDTLRSLNRKTYFKVKCDGMLSTPILDQLGVNQGVTRVQHFSEHIWPILVIIWRSMLVFVYQKQSLLICCGPTIWSLFRIASLGCKSNWMACKNFARRT